MRVCVRMRMYVSGTNFSKLPSAYLKFKPGTHIVFIQIHTDTYEANINKKDCPFHFKVTST